MNEPSEPIMHGALEVTFRCGACNEVAAIVRYDSGGGTCPDPILKSIVDRSESDWLVISGFPGTQGHALDSRAAYVRSALQHSSAKQLYDIHFPWAAFYCSECNESYCWNCWQSRVVMDEEDPGWYDCTHGTCPKGHEKMIDD